MPDDSGQIEKAVLRQASVDDLPILCDLADAMGSAKAQDYFELSLEYQKAGRRLIFIASVEGAKGIEDVGYCMLAWNPKYGYFRHLGISEIQDLNVIPDFRRRGIARAMIAHCEALAREKGHKEIGIGVGMDASYGAAQRLYVQLGYVPDGNGLTYDRKTIAHGAFYPVDDDMSLMMVKAL